MCWFFLSLAHFSCIAPVSLSFAFWIGQNNVQIKAPLSLFFHKDVFRQLKWDLFAIGARLGQEDRAIGKVGCRLAIHYC
jgi:hypothetical protein